ncbi:hypothetical protein BT69DRAFT_1272316 [Atractiella rhizophila]|nr:hypothetical protein BT69DRAFT_1272316 [Atractiella rhizophila]
MNLILIAAITPARGLGVSAINAMPWNLPPDMSFFRQVTSSHAVIMGRKTWESIPPAFRPLKNRINVVISTTLGPTELQKHKATHVVPSLDEALRLLQSMEKTPQRVFVIGGARVYNESIEKANRLLLTRIMEPDYDCDVFFPEWKKEEWTKASDSELWDWTGTKRPNGPEERAHEGIKFKWEMWTRIDEETH